MWQTWRQRNRPDARWVFVLDGQVLWHRVTSVDVHREQLRHLLDVRSRPAVSLGVIPLTADRTGDGVHGVWPEESFSIVDTDLVNVELVSGYLSMTQPDEVAAYIAAWKRLFALAVHGDKAAEQIHAALAALDDL